MSETEKERIALALDKCKVDQSDRRKNTFLHRKDFFSKIKTLAPFWLSIYKLVRAGKSEDEIAGIIRNGIEERHVHFVYETGWAIISSLVLIAGWITLVLIISCTTSRSVDWRFIGNVTLLISIALIFVTALKIINQWKTANRYRSE